MAEKTPRSSPGSARNTSVILVVVICGIVTIITSIILDMHYRIGELAKEDINLKLVFDDRAEAVEARLEQLRRDLTPRSSSKLLLFKNNSFLFNSWENKPVESDQPQHARYLEAWGNKKGSMDWLTNDNGRTGSFSYSTNKSATPDALASSGGYITFYDDPRDRLSTQSIRFRCKAASEHGAVDFGIRIAVDNPRATGDRELATYQFDSVASEKRITTEWQIFEISISDFVNIHYRPPFPQGLDGNILNKLVFYVDARRAEQCPQATLWFSDIELRSTLSRQ
jgi:hypothetical protein